MSSLSGATIVTAFINLHKYDKEKRPVRSEDQYIEDGKQVLHLNVPMIIFTERENYHKILNNRLAAGLLEKTMVIIIDFMSERDIPVNKWRSQIESLHHIKTNDPGLPLATRGVFSSSKNSVNYHILMYSKVDLVDRAITLNPFNSSHFVWLDMGIKHVALQIEEIYNWINYIPDKMRLLEITKFQTRNVDVLAQYSFLEHGTGGCGGGLLTGNIASWCLFRELFLGTAKHMMDNGFLFLDEAIYAYLVFKYRELFDNYYGWFPDICQNYLRATSIYKDNTDSSDYLFVNIRQCLSFDDQANALKILYYMEPAVINSNGMSHNKISMFLELYLLAKWYVEPRAVLDDRIIGFLSRIFKSEVYKDVADYIKSTGYINNYVNKDALLSIVN